MKLLKTLAILLLLVTALHSTARGQQFNVANLTVSHKQFKGDTIRVYFNPAQYWIFTDLSKNECKATIIGDTIFIHKQVKPFSEIKEQSSEHRYLYWKNETYRYRYAFYDIGLIHLKRKGIRIY